MCDFIQAVRKFQELTRILQKKNWKTTLYIFAAESTEQWAYTFSIYTTAFKCGALKVFIHVYLYLRILRIFPVKIHLLLSLNSEEAQNLQVIRKVKRQINL